MTKRSESASNPKGTVNMQNIAQLEIEHREHVTAQAEAAEALRAMQTRLEAAKRELATLPDRRKAEFAAQIDAGLKPNVDDLIWRRLQLEAEVADLPHVIKAQRSVHAGHAAAVASIARRISDTSREADVEAKKRRIAEGLAEGISADEIRGELGLSAQEFKHLTPEAFNDRAA